MRAVYALIIVVGCAASMWAQREPCLVGTDSRDCGIKITLNPPPKEPDENAISVPNEVTIDVPLRLHATKVQLNTGAAGTGIDQFKLFSETAHYKKVDGTARFRVQIKSCPQADSSFVFEILSERLPYPVTVNPKPFECKQRTNP
jgi:hypothetical protein